MASAKSASQRSLLLPTDVTQVQFGRDATISEYQTFKSGPAKRRLTLAAPREIDESLFVVDQVLNEESDDDSIGGQRCGSENLSLFIIFLVFTSNILARYLFIFLCSVPTDGMSPEEAKEYNLKVGDIFSFSHKVVATPFHFPFLICIVLKYLLDRFLTMPLH